MFCFVIDNVPNVFTRRTLENRQEAVSNARRTHGDKYLDVTGPESLKCKCHVINDNEDYTNSFRFFSFTIF